MSFDPNTTIAENINTLEYMRDLRAKVLAGEHISSEEYALVLDSLRKNRTAVVAKKSKAGAASAAAKPAPTAATVAADVLFDF